MSATYRFTARPLAIFGIYFALVIGYRPANALFENDACRIQRTGNAGVCKIIQQCPEILPDYRRGRVPTICGYHGHFQIVCCPQRPADVIPPSPRSLPGSDTAPQHQRISARKCQDYQSAVYEEQTLYTVNGAEIKRNTSVCNLDSTSYIVNGEETKPSEFPHMALVGYGSGDTSTWQCGGSLISDQYVLTAGHCIRTRIGLPTKVALGVHSVTGSTDNAYEDHSREFAVASTVVHPDYHQAASNYNDIGLIRLDRAARLSPYIRPACLPSGADDLLSLRSAVVSGWGHTEFRGAPSDKLMKVRLDLYSASECNATYTQTRLRKVARGVDGETQMCAGSRTERKDSCQGDSGGPLQVQHPNAERYCMYSVQGVTSFGVACGGVNTPGVYTRVWAFVPWIEAIVWPDEVA